MGTRNAKTGGKEKAKKGHPRARENIMMYTSMAGFLSFFFPSSFMGIQQQVCGRYSRSWGYTHNGELFLAFSCFFFFFVYVFFLFCKYDDGLAGIFAKRSPDISKTRPTSPGPSRRKGCDVDVLDAAKVHLCLLVCYPSAPLLSSHPPFSLCQGQSRAWETQKRATTMGKRKQAERSAVEALAGATVTSV
ncbi:uncharacterized protein ARB_04540 [Trichophyton benhamiae CBS 112371]|uniref:Transmembrane protein n=1 Tax=Arthroderma benhamiae (strain ATCC MYA-4681 / CBS 112371) TaxID=663331 RepID=D4AJU0_ARTBC|nr:uncharacterized protein ARB_04540 [Trichophyton benhamiae CBS 112371]EFE37013.1 hypothetical protein ARB_04540 [Trichophyton benhamiae CBS 112371]